MGFTKDIRTMALVASARHCCVCHRRKGVKVEVHHIIPEATSHDNSLDNAISLCFDCHCDAGHYNSRHPRGTKFSPEELKRHREEWYRIVKENQIPSSENHDLVRFRYHLIKSFQILSEIQKGKFSKIWGNAPLYMTGEIGSFQRKIVNFQRNDYRRCDHLMNHFKSEEDFLEQRAGSRGLNSEEKMIFPVFQTTRTLDQLDIQYILQNDPITLLLFQSGGDPEDLMIPLGHFCACSDAFLDEIILRPIWPVFLEIYNTSKLDLTINSIVSNVTNNPEKGLQRVSEMECTMEKVPISSMKIKPDESIFFPIMTLLGPFSGEIENTSFSTFSMEGTRGFDILESVGSTSNIESYMFLGKSIWPVSIQGCSEGDSFTQEIHECDFSRFFTLDRDYMCGSCPHYLAVDDLGGRVYQKEIFANACNQKVIENHKIPQHCSAIEIVELEDEVTMIDSLSIGDKVNLRDLILLKGDSVLISCAEATNFKVSGGFYPLESKEFHTIGSLQKNKLVRNYLRKT